MNLGTPSGPIQAATGSSRARSVSALPNAGGTGTHDSESASDRRVPRMPPYPSGNPHVSEIRPRWTSRTQKPVWQPLAGQSGVQRWVRPQAWQ